MPTKYKLSSEDTNTQASFFMRHSMLISAMVGSLAFVGLGIGLYVGLAVGIPFFGFGAALTGPLFAVIGLIVGGLVGLLLGLLGAVAQEWLNKPAIEEKTHFLEKPDEDLTLDLDANYSCEHPQKLDNAIVVCVENELIQTSKLDKPLLKVIEGIEDSAARREINFNELGYYLSCSTAVKKKNRVSITDFYAYVFEKKADVKPIAYIADKKIPTKEKQETSKKSVTKVRKTLSPEEIQSRKQHEKRIEMDNFKASLGGDLISNPNFRIMLRQTNAQSLERFLFDNSIDPLNDNISSQYTFPEDRVIKSKFEDLNSIYHFYDNRATYYANAVEQFVTLFKGCKLIADYVENNNDNDNSVPALHAYKILVLFNKKGTSTSSPFAKFEEYLKTHQGYTQPHPVHDMLVTELPKNDEQAIHDLEGWQRLVHKHGLKAMQYFQRAAIVEKTINKAPSSLKQASDILMKSSYKHYDAYPQLAALCMHYNVSEETYNKCLEIRKKIKVKDNLPGKEFDIDGKSISPMYAGYYLAKLPIDDPHAYLLGHLTNCCQSIGSDSELCVIDGITRENNGFYVLLKNKKKLELDGYRLEDDSINYEKFEIVGQGYAWLSRRGNLTFDSWENLRAGEGITSCHLMKLPDSLNLPITMRRSRLFNDTEHALILFRKQLYYVDVKKSKLTEFPVNQKNQNLLTCFNQLEEGKRLSADEETLSYIQNTLGISPDDTIAVKMLTRFAERVTSAREPLRVTIGLGGKTPPEFKKRRIYGNPESIAEGDQYGDSKKQALVFSNKEKQEKIFNEFILTALKKYFPGVNHFDSLICANEIVSMQQTLMICDLISNKNYETLWHSVLTNKKFKLFRETHRISTWETLGALHNANDLNQTSFHLLDNFIRTPNLPDYLIDQLVVYQNDITQAINILIEGKVYHHDIYGLLLDNIKHINVYISAFNHLISINSLSLEYCQYALKLKNYAALISLGGLAKKHIKILLNFKPSELETLRSAFTHFRESKILPTEEMLDVIMDNAGKNAYVMAHILVSLKKADLLNPNALSSLLEWSKNQISSDLWNLSKNLGLLQHVKLLTLDKCEVLLDNLSYGEQIYSAIRDIGPSLNDINWKIITSNHPYLSDISLIFRHLAIVRLLNLDNCSSILSKIESASVLHKAILAISQSAEPLMTNITLERLLLKPESSDEISSALVNLYKKLLQSINNASTQQNPSGFFASPENKLIIGIERKLLAYLNGTTHEFDRDEVNILLEQSDYASNCKTLIDNGYPMPQEFHETFYPTRVEPSWH